MDCLYGMHHLLCKQALALGAAPRMPSVGASNGSPRSLMHASPATSAATTCAGAEGQAARAGDADMLRSPGNGYGTVGGVNNGGEGLGAGGGGLGAAVHSQHPPPATVPPATTRGGGGDDAGAPDAPDAVSAASAVGAQASVGSSSSVHAVGAAGVGDAVGTAGMEGAHVTSPASAASSGLFARFFGWGGAEGGTGKPVADATVACQKVEADERIAGQQSGTVGAREYDALFGTHVPQDVVPPRPAEDGGAQEAADRPFDALFGGNVTSSPDQAFPSRPRDTEGGQTAGWESLERDGSRLWQRWALVVTTLFEQSRPRQETEEGGKGKEGQEYAVHMLERMFLPAAATSGTSDGGAAQPAGDGVRAGHASAGENGSVSGHRCATGGGGHVENGGGGRTSVEAAMAALPGDAWLLVFDRVFWALQREMVKGAGTSRTHQAATAAAPTDQRTQVLRIWLLQCSVLLRYQQAIISLAVFPAIWRQFLEETSEWYTWSQRRPLGRGGEEEDSVGVLAGESVREYLANLVAVLASGGAFAQGMWEDTWRILNGFSPSLNLGLGRDGDASPASEQVPESSSAGDTHEAARAPAAS
eukprot:Tamp_09316.p1 GENE.Tamp_09316~~Tamp_09316.p1  ORF type:complete len:692 (-),score=105.36 Tamp_09316:118-1884(-)